MRLIQKTFIYYLLIDFTQLGINFNLTAGKQREKSCKGLAGSSAQCSPTPSGGPSFLSQERRQRSRPGRRWVVREALSKSVRADAERFWPSRKFKKWRNPVWISHFFNCTNGLKDPAFSRRRFIQSFPNSRSQSRPPRTPPGAPFVQIAQDRGLLGGGMKFRPWP